MTPRVAILLWGDAIEDFLDPLGLTLAHFRDEMEGGWLFGYVGALRAAGVSATVVCCSREVRRVEHSHHQPSGAPLLVLPTTRAALALTGRVDPSWPSYLATPPLLLAREARRAGWRALLCQEYEYPRFDVCAALGRLIGLPVFATFQGGVEPTARFERVLRPLTLRAAAGLIVAPRAEGERVHERYGVPEDRITRLVNPLDVAELAGGGSRRDELGLPADAVVVAWHGRVDVHAKGLDVLLDAWARLSARADLPERRLLLVGTGGGADEVRERLGRGDLPGVTWVDRYVLDKGEIGALLASADLYAFPSRREGFPVAPIEAMAVGLPVVAAAASGVADIFPPGEDSGGVVVPVGDAAALASALAGLLADAGERERLGALARRRVEDTYSYDAVGAVLRRVLLREGSASRHSSSPAR